MHLLGTMNFSKSRHMAPHFSVSLANICNVLSISKYCDLRVTVTVTSEVIDYSVELNAA